MGIGRDTYANKRWLVTPTTSAPLSWRLREGRRIDDFPTEVVANAEKAVVVEDFPFTTDGIPIANERAKLLLEKLAPNQIQYIPMPILVDGVPIVDKYWVLNCLHMLDCIDIEKSKAYKVTENPPYYTEVFIDPAKVPPDIMIFRPSAHRQQIHIRSAMRDAFRKEKLTGWVCYPSS